MSKCSPLAALAVFSLLAACSSAPPALRIRTNPPDASVYKNGALAQKGMALPQEFDFSNVDRICLQATCPGYEPVIQYVTAREIESLIRNNSELTINLRQR